jgi:two-component system cell cycle response regulator DivK
MPSACVLVIDDQLEVREMLAQCLAVSGFLVLQAQDGAEGVAIASREHPQVILMDLMMPRMDGWEAARRLKADARTKGIAIIAVSGHHDADDRQRAHDCGCAAFIPKPFDVDRLIEAVRAAL